MQCEFQRVSEDELAKVTSSGIKAFSSGKSGKGPDGFLMISAEH